MSLKRQIKRTIKLKQSGLKKRDYYRKPIKEENKEIKQTKEKSKPKTSIFKKFRKRGD